MIDDVPVAIHIQWNQGNIGHAVVACGASGSGLVVVADPNPKNGTTVVHYSVLNSSYCGTGRWLYSYLIQGP